MYFFCKVNLHRALRQIDIKYVSSGCLVVIDKMKMKYRTTALTMTEMVMSTIIMDGIPDRGVITIFLMEVTEPMWLE